MQIITLSITWLTLCILVAAWHRGRGYDAAPAFFLSLFFSPLAGIVYVLWSGVDGAALDERLIQGKKKRRCPACAELVNPQAKVCPHCRVQYRPAS